MPTAENLGHEKTTRRSKYRPLYFVSISSSFFSFFFYYFFLLIFLVIGITTMRENKEQTVTSEDEDVAAPPLVQVASVQAGKRKSKPISSAVDLDDLPSRRGPKKQKSGKTSLPKVPKFVPLTVNLDGPLVDVEPVQTVHLVQSDPPPPPKASRKPSSSEPFDRPSNLVLDESYAWRTLKGIVTDRAVNECYNMSMKEFECSGVHDLFKVSLSFILV